MKINFIIFIFVAICGTSVAINAQKLEDTTLTIEANQFSLEQLLSEQITGVSKYSQTLFDVPASVTILTADMIKRFGYRSIDDLIRTASGFYFNFDGFMPNVMVRGITTFTSYSNTIVLMIDGNVINDGIFESCARINRWAISLEAIERVEFICGSPSSIYGSSAMLGVINIITKKGNDVNGFGVNYTNASFGTNSVDLLYGRSFSNTQDILFSIKGEKSDGRDIYFSEYDDRLTENTDTNSPTYNQYAKDNGLATGMNRSTHIGALLKARSGNFTLKSNFRYGKMYYPTATFGSLFNYPNNYAEEIAFTGSVLWENQFANHKISITPHYDWTEYTAIYGYEYQFLLPDRFVDYAQIEHAYAHKVGVNVSDIWDISPHNRMVIGVEYNRTYDVDFSLTERLSQYPADDDGFSTLTNILFDKLYIPHQIASIFIEDTHNFGEDFILSYGQRFDYCSELDNVVAIPRGSFIWNATQSTALKLIVGSGFRNPTYYERHYYDGMSILAAEHIKKLEPEYSINYELKYIQKIYQQFLVNTGIYYNTFTNLITLGDTLVPNPNIPNNTMLMHYYRNCVNAQSMGFNASILWMAPEIGTNFDVNYNFSYSKYDNSVDNNAGASFNFPRHIVNLNYSQYFLSNFVASLAGHYESRINDALGNSMNSVLQFDLSLAYLPKKVNAPFNTSILERFNATFKIANITSQTAYWVTDNALPITRFPRLPRNYVFQIGYDFGFMDSADE